MDGNDRRGCDGNKGYCGGNRSRDKILGNIFITSFHKNKIHQPKEKKKKSDQSPLAIYNLKCSTLQSLSVAIQS